MANFFSKIFGGIKKAVTVVENDASSVVNKVAPFEGLLTALIPPPVGTILGYVIHVEQITQQFAAKGSDKKAAVISLVKLSDPNVDSTKLSNTIDTLVGLFNDWSTEVKGAPIASQPVSTITTKS